MSIISDWRFGLQLPLSIDAGIWRIRSVRLKRRGLERIGSSKGGIRTCGLSVCHDRNPRPLLETSVHDASAEAFLPSIEVPVSGVTASSGEHSVDFQSSS